MLPKFLNARFCIISEEKCGTHGHGYNEIVVISKKKKVNHCGEFHSKFSLKLIKRPHIHQFLKMTLPTKLLMFGLVKTSLSQYYDSLETDLNLDITSFNKSQILYSYHPSIGEHNFGGEEVFGEEQVEFYLHANETEFAPGLRAGIEFFKSGHSLAIAIPEMLRLYICWHVVHKDTENISKRHMHFCHWKLHHTQNALH